MKISQEIKHLVAAKGLYGSEEAIVYGRQLAYDVERGVNTDLNEFDQKLLKLMKKENLIRPASDFTLYFKLARFYKDVYPGLRRTFKTKVSHLTDEEYENFKPLDESAIKDVRKAIDLTIKDSKDHIVLLLHYCLYYEKYGKEMIRYSEIEKDLKMPCSMVKRSLRRSIERMRTFSYLLPKIFDAPTDYNQRVEELRNRLYEIHASSIYREERSIMQELLELENKPFIYEGESDDLIASLKDDMPIESLDLSVKALHFLKSNAFTKVSDIVQYPSEKWQALMGLGLETIEEIVEKMHKVGYRSFAIDS